MYTYCSITTWIYWTISWRCGNGEVPAILLWCSSFWRVGYSDTSRTQCNFILTFFAPLLQHHFLLVGQCQKISVVCTGNPSNRHRLSLQDVFIYNCWAGQFLFCLRAALRLHFITNSQFIIINWGDSTYFSHVPRKNVQKVYRRIVWSI